MHRAIFHTPFGDKGYIDKARVRCIKSLLMLQLAEGNHVHYWHLADISTAPAVVRFRAIADKTEFGPRRFVRL